MSCDRGAIYKCPDILLTYKPNKPVNAGSVFVYEVNQQKVRRGKDIRNSSVSA